MANWSPAQIRLYIEMGDYNKYVTKHLELLGVFNKEGFTETIAEKIEQGYKEWIQLLKRAIHHPYDQWRNQDNPNSGDLYYLVVFSFFRFRSQENIKT